MQLHDEFIRRTRDLMGQERFERYLQSFEEDAPVSIRLNPLKVSDGRWQMAVDAEPVPWCRNAYYLNKRPNFTFDPLFHAGCYYVQEAASMFLDEILRQQLPSDISHLTVLDMCAAPGGKSTLLRAALPQDCVLYSNEPIRNRASILLENVQKWGYEHHFVTNLYPKDYRKAKSRFDLILCDVPCSGEGMFRKDEATIKEWSPQNVEKCWQLQREIVSDAWQCLNEGGILIYSTCTFNIKENEENIRWMMEELGAEVLPIKTKAEWHITGSLLEGFHEPVYRFIPGITRSEGLFVCVLRKSSFKSVSPMETSCFSQGNKVFPLWKQTVSPMETNQKHLDVPHVELSYQQTMAYLRGEALQLPEETPRGEVEVCFMGQSLGLAKNIGTRANNLYPKPWRIKTTHIPNEYEPIIKQI